VVEEKVMAIFMSMLLRFAAENVRSFRDEVELSLMATRLSEPGAVRQVRLNEKGSPVGVLPAACVFGANASGKSNVLRALADMRTSVLTSFRAGDPDSGVPRKPFRLDAESSDRPSRLEVDLMIDDVRYEYGFVFDDSQFLEEWAYSYPRGKQVVLFEREGMAVAHGVQGRPLGQLIARLLRPNALYLSTAAAGGHELLMPLYRWFGDNLVLAEAANRQLRHGHTVSMIQNEATRQRVLDLVRVADLGVVDIAVEQLDPDHLDRLRRATRILSGKEGDLDSGDDASFDALRSVRLSHQGEAAPVEFDSDEESFGTLVWIGLLGPMIDALERGTVLLADELDSSLHPRLVEEVVRLFQDPKTNRNGSQLIANAFDTSLLGDSVGHRPLGRDQVWFAEKSNTGVTTLRSLADYAPRKQEDIAGRYLRGRFGGVPVIDHHEFADVIELARAQ
jgi:uncharacterized protein